MCCSLYVILSVCTFNPHRLQTITLNSMAYILISYFIKVLWFAVRYLSEENCVWKLFFEHWAKLSRLYSKNGPIHTAQTPFNTSIPISSCLITETVKFSNCWAKYLLFFQQTSMRCRKDYNTKKEKMERRKYLIKVALMS